MVSRIHILGASGSGTTILGQALSAELGYKHFDTDYYYWLPTTPPYQLKREVKGRQELLMKDLESSDKWILTGSLCGWGDIFIPLFDLVVFLWIPQEIRINMLIEREKERYGENAIKPSGERYEQYRAFVNWASDYDSGDINVRSRALHEMWLDGLECHVVRIEGDKTVAERVGVLIGKMVG